MKFGRGTNNLHENVCFSVLHLRSACAALVLILHLVDVPERFLGLCVSSSRWIHKGFGMINRWMNIIHIIVQFLGMMSEGLTPERGKVFYKMSAEADKDTYCCIGKQAAGALFLDPT